MKNLILVIVAVAVCGVAFFLGRVHQSYSVRCTRSCIVRREFVAKRSDFELAVKAISRERTPDMARNVLSKYLQGTGIGQIIIHSDCIQFIYEAIPYDDDSFISYCPNGQKIERWMSMGMRIRTYEAIDNNWCYVETSD